MPRAGVSKKGEYIGGTCVFQCKSAAARRSLEGFNNKPPWKRRKAPAPLPTHPPGAQAPLRPGSRQQAGHAAERQAQNLPRHIPLVTLDYHLFILVRVSSARDPKASLSITH
uniref:Uncharacterized protein n=1 Tax=Coccidioides posadasii RMSCC 3488 TaxID=454284 RepID=A0A0J6FGF3_COCPO|nr:hypothetical protein CPAG_04762 [Coccidioides posadasii RMSCC 3488]